MNAIVVSVEYGDILSVTLPYNRHHFDRVMVVTTPDDKLTLDVASQNNCETFQTRSFYDDGASFNKWKALEEGLDRLGREGWLCLLDADILWPKRLPFATEVFERLLAPGKLYGCLRRMYEDVVVSCNEPAHLYVPPEKDWGRLKIHPNVNEWAGYTQIFHASDARLGPPPWHQINWLHAGGADSFFQAKWPPTIKVRLPFEVLHIGPAGQNWCGRTTEFLGGDRPPDAEERFQRLRRFLIGRRGKQGGDRFTHEKSSI